MSKEMFRIIVTRFCRQDKAEIIAVARNLGLIPKDYMSDEQQGLTGDWIEIDPLLNNYWILGHVAKMRQQFQVQAMDGPKPIRVLIEID